MYTLNENFVLVVAAKDTNPGLFFGQFYGGQLRLVASEALSFFKILELFWEMLEFIWKIPEFFLPHH